MERIPTDPVVTRKRYTGVKRFFTIFFLVIIIALAGYFYWRYYFTYSSGERYGLLQKFSHKGNIFKTYEGEMILSSIRGNFDAPIASEKFFFSVTDKDLANKLMRMQGDYVTVHYNQKNGTLSWRGDSEYIVDSVRMEK